MTLRRLLVLVDALPPEAAFRSAVEDRVPISEISAAVFDVWSALVGGKKQHPRWTLLERKREELEREKLLAEKRAQARAWKKSAVS